MDHSTESQTDRKELKKTMSPAEVWALAVGAIIGWGCFVLPGTRFLPDAGPLGTCLAFLIGGGLLCTVALCYSILIKVYPVAGGSFTYAYVGFGHPIARWRSTSAAMLVAGGRESVSRT